MASEQEDIIALLKNQLLELTESNRLLLEINSTQSKTIDELKNTILQLNSSLAWLKKKVFGKMSEKCSPIKDTDPLLPFDNGEFAQIEDEINKAMQSAREEVHPTKINVSNPKRHNRIILDNLPVVSVIINPENIDLNNYVKIGEERTRTLELKPGYLYVKEIIRPTYAIKTSNYEVENESSQVVTASLPLMPIYKGMAGCSLLSEILLQKYEYHIPFYRQVKQFEHLGVKLSASTLEGWFNPICKLLKPIYLEIKKKVLSCDYIQVDETTLPVLDHIKHKASKEYIWAVRSEMLHLMFYHYDEGSRSQKTAENLLKPFKGYLQSDGYSAYDIFEDKEEVCLVGCLAHIRRHIESCKDENMEYSQQGLKIIQDLYNVEHMADEQHMSYEERSELRMRLSKPLLDGFELWLKNTYSKVLKRSLVGKAIAYAYPLIPRMRPYLYDGRIKIDNNACENCLRPLVLSRKNFLFCGDHNAAENTAIICSLLASCKASNINPREWLNDVIAKMPYYIAQKSKMNIADLLPNVWIANH